jgi:hypothetical protein
MATKKLTTKGYAKGVGQRSKKRTGYIVQSIRILVADNKKMHNAAKAENRSFNGWAQTVLLREADKVLKRVEAAKQKKVTTEA